MMAMHRSHPHRLERLCLVATIPSILLADEIDDAAADGADFATQAFPDATVDARRQCID